ncbi:ankyrin repeat domain-containing protein [Candidatus Mesenet endosymbiont of Agriotes lineatus]|uniref:ankyrin repeat domain-containing protein n=1 Tax=Candidatus Mesenet endosymbiont of Agriotes lineatus TaxID=3077948 RepID=UPI0030D462D9
MGNSIDSVKLLISKGADVNAKDKNGHTPLYVAIYKNNVDIAKLLISNGADINAKDNSGNTLLQVASEEGNEEMVTLLEEAAREQAKNSTTEQMTTIESFLEEITNSNRNNGIIDMRSSGIPDTTPMMLSHLRQNLGNITNSTSLLLGSDAENGISNNASSLLSTNGSGLLMFVSYVLAYVYKKMFSTDGPSTVMNAPSLGQISKLQK